MNHYTHLGSVEKKTPFLRNSNRFFLTFAIFFRESNREKQTDVILVEL